ncbi:hypothetical protein [Nocardia sienata]|uniref:hypothetical protein n=1 Tax=Nocardia sienata TaxID=248552 RepID=UPI000A4D5BE9|nr:hypothetical protein [Nocardia sienata]
MRTNTSPTPAEVLSWDISALAGISERASLIADTVLKAADSMHTTIHYDIPWESEARTAAGDRADREHTDMRAIGTAFDDLATACAGAARDMEFPLAEIKTIFRLYVISPVAVAEDWTVSGVKDWNTEAGVQLSRLSGLVSTLTTADAQWGAKIADANAALQVAAPDDILFQTSNKGLPQPPGGWSSDPAYRLAQEIAYGHAWEKHHDDFNGMTQDDLAEKVHQIMTGPHQTERLGKDKNGNPVMMSWDGYVVIVDPSTTDHGTVYRPKDPLGEFIRLTNQVEDPSLGPPTPPGGLGGTYPGKPGTGPTR